MNEYEQLRRIAEELQHLRDSGYDGPFIGEALEPLMKAFHAWEREQIANRLYPSGKK